jgi:hypothetical protein
VTLGISRHSLWQQRRRSSRARPTVWPRITGIMNPLQGHNLLPLASHEETRNHFHRLNPKISHPDHRCRPQALYRTTRVVTLGAPEHQTSEKSNAQVLRSLLSALTRHHPTHAISRISLPTPARRRTIARKPVGVQTHTWDHKLLTTALFQERSINRAVVLHLGWEHRTLYLLGIAVRA